MVPRPESARHWKRAFLVTLVLLVVSNFANSGYWMLQTVDDAIARDKLESQLHYREKEIRAAARLVTDLEMGQDRETVTRILRDRYDFQTVGAENGLVVRLSREYGVAAGPFRMVFDDDRLVRVDTR